MSKKPKPMKPRGVRFEDPKWNALEKLAAKDKTKKERASDHARWAVDEYLEKRGIKV